MQSRQREHCERLTVALRPSLATALGGLALVLAAFTFAVAPLLVGGIGFLLIGLLTPAAVVICARGGHVQRVLSERRVIEDQPLEITIEVTRGRLGIPGAQIFDPLAGASVPLSGQLSVISGARKLELRVVTRAQRRGRRAFAPPSLLLSDPLGLVLVTKAGAGGADELLVLPRTEPVQWLAGTRRRPAHGRLASLTAEPLRSGEVDGLRPYVEGAPAARIHWPALARGAGLLERRLVSERQTQPLVVLDAREDPQSPSGAWLDAAVRAAASITLELARAGATGILLPGANQPTRVLSDLVAWPAVHAKLALVQATQRPPRLARHATGALTIVVAAGLDEPALDAVRVQGRGLVLVVPAELGTRLALPASFEVSGCAGFVLGARGARRGAAA